MMKLSSVFRTLLLIVLFLPACISASGQSDTTGLFKRIDADTSKVMNMDAGYNRPFLTAGKLPVAIGGYLEANTMYAQTDGVSDGFSFQARRLTLFFSSTIARRIKFLSEIEFEDGTKEINIETAMVDIEFHPLFNLRGGILLNPIGSFNQNHDGPRWDFIDRPLESVTVLPATLSNAGFGIHGKYARVNWILGYEAMLSNGFDDRVISNTQNRTSLSEGKSNPEKFEESNSGLPMFTGRLALRNRKAGEIGISYMTGVYNKWKEDGLTIDRKRSASAIALDFNASFLDERVTITGEASRVFVDVPESYSQTFGSMQSGIFTDIVLTVLQRRMFGWDKARLNAGIRIEYVDYNQGRFRETGGNIGDDAWAVVPSLAFRPAGAFVLRFNYRHQQDQDLLGNEPSKTGVILFGFSTYF